MNANNLTKCAFIALVGAPNAGKSTLLNQLVGSKISIVTPKIQTTRTRVTGVSIVENTQLIFVDTPGVFLPKKTLDKAMVKAAWSALDGMDMIALLVDSKQDIDANTQLLLKGLEAKKTRIILLLNKIDTVDKPRLLALTEELNQSGLFTDTFMISALNGNGVDDIKNYFCTHASEGPWMYPEDQVSDVPLRVFAAEITREKLMLRLQQELPYQLMVETEQWEEKDNSVTIHQVIYVMKEGQKKIVIGKGGQMLRQVGEQSRKEISRLLDKKVHLHLFVKVRENWQELKESYRLMGLEFPR